MANTVLITGTSTGIGRACVERMASSGWTVYAGVRKESDGEQLKSSVTGDVRPVLLDVTDQDRIREVASILEAELAPAGGHGGRGGLGGLGGLVNNAGVAVGGPLEALSDEDWRWHFDVNVFGPVNLTRACFDLLRSARGRVVNIGSVSSRAGAPFMAPYSGTKHAIAGISESLRFEVEPFGMKVACVEPGEVKTAIWDKGDDQLAHLDDKFDPDMLARYDRLVDVMHGFVDEGRRKGVPASAVADAVHHALTAERPRHRYLVGPDAKLTGLATRLPDPVRHRMLSLALSRWARSGKRIRAR